MKLLRKNWFLLLLIVALFVGYRWSVELAAIASVEWLKWGIVAVTMFLMAWPLEFGNFKRAAMRPAAPLLASVLNVVMIPLLVWPLMLWIGGELGGGMMVAAATPCTLASAAIWTRRAGGNDSVAMMVTLFTNATCFLVMPFWIYVQTGNTIDSSLLIGTIYKLFLFVVLPITAAQVLRFHRGSAAWATRRKSLLSTVAMLGLLAMVLMGAVSMGLRMGVQSEAIRAWSVVLVGALMLLVHCGVFFGGLEISRWLGLPVEDGIAVAFAGSQKTLMIGLTVAILLHFSIIPIVLYHVTQLVVDSIFADRLRKRPSFAVR